MTTLMKAGRQTSRVAVKIHEHLVGPARRIRLDYLPSYRWEELGQIVTRLQLAQRQGWQVASRNLIIDLDYSIQRLRIELDAFRSSLPDVARHQSVVLPGEIAADLAMLAEEFEDSQLDLKEKTVTVQTLPIVLEDHDLGAFRVVLKWERIGQLKPYEVIADTPRPPEDESDVTHPHVRDRVLCEGEGAAAIKSALATGRLLDFFVLVRQILQTYNPESAHVQLNHWGGALCRDCGWRIPASESLSCERCDHTVCSDCISSCPGCDRYTCSGCFSDCGVCGDSYCSGCLENVAGSPLLHCSSCLEKKEETDDAEAEAPAVEPAETPAASPSAPTPAPEPKRVGEVIASARPRANRSRRVRRVGTRRPAARRRRTARAAGV